MPVGLVHVWLSDDVYWLRYNIAKLSERQKMCSRSTTSASGPRWRRQAWFRASRGPLALVVDRTVLAVDRTVPGVDRTATAVVIQPAGPS